MVKFGCHAFVWVGEWTTDSGNYAIEQVGKTGFEYIEIPLLKPDEFDAASHRAALNKAGIQGTTSLALPKEVHMPFYPEAARDFLYAALAKTEEVGSQYLGGCIAYHLGTLTGKPPTAEERAIVVEMLKDVAAEAKRRGITILLEACNRYETYLYNTLADTRETILAVGADNLKLHADTYHMNIEEEGFYTPIVNTADVLAYIHMSESHRGLVGSGTVNWDQVWRGLADIHFDGFLVLESFAAVNPDLQAATCLWRPTNQPSEVLGSEGIKFLREGAAKYGLG
ncbi:MAG: sugar phosphate isomerase/epimerase [Chloroflexota bacterium]|nr:sugar phosphate isomerase/epimerase [Chloroflexota bacterium]